MSKPKPDNFPINQLCFTLIKGKRVCNLCSRQFKQGTGADSLRAHWHSSHPDDGKEEKGEEKEEVEKTWEERCNEVIVKFCEQAHVTQQFKWSGVKEQMLESLTIEAGLQILTDEMKRKVKAYVQAPHIPAVLPVSNDIDAI